MGRRREALAQHLLRAQTSPAKYLLVLWLCGCALLALFAWIGVQLDLPFRIVSPLLLLLIVSFCLLDSFLSSVVFSVFAVGLLDYYFVEPLYSVEVASAQDVFTLVVFLFTSFVVTGLVRKLRLLAEQHRAQARLLDLTHDSIFVRDMGDQITYWNRGARELYGWTGDDAIGRTTHDLLRTRFPLPLAEINEILLRTGRWEGELVHTTRDGVEISVSSRWALQRDPIGRTVGVLETNTDITQRKKTEAALSRIQATYLAEAQKLSATGSFGWNIFTGEILWSDETFRIFGFEPTMKPSMEAVFERVHPEDIERVRQSIELAAQEKRPFDLEHRLLMPDGTVKHLHIVASLAVDEPDMLQFVGAMMDKTAAKQAQAALHQTHAQLAYVSRVTTLGELSASIAHEVNQPLAAIVTNAQASLRFQNREPPMYEEVRDATRRIIADGARAGEIVQRIRALTKKAAPQAVPLELNEVIRESLALVQHELTSHKVALRMELAVAPLAALGDFVQLQQVIVNLIINGVQAMAAVEGGVRELAIRSARTEDGQALVQIRDSGGGIDPDAADRLFEAFFTTKPNGMGMGLSICRTIIDAHGGRVWATDNGGDRGATVQFTLPPIELPA